MGSDLPDPEPMSTIGFEGPSRKKFLLVFLVGTVVYSLLHKLLIPLSLKILGGTRPEYAEIDYYFFLPVLLFFVYRKDSVTQRSHELLAGLCVAHAINEAYLSATLRTQGWLMFSHVLSSAPLALYVLIWKAMTPKPIWGFRLVPSLALGLAGMAFLPSLGLLMSEQKSLAQEVVRPALDETPGSCGAAEVLVRVSTDSQAMDPAVSIKSCGFFPSVVKVASDSIITIKSELGSAANVHVMAHRGNGRRQVLNKVLLPGAVTEIDTNRLREGEVLLIYSDARPEFGVALVVLLDGVSVGVKAHRATNSVEFFRDL